MSNLSALRQLDDSEIVGVMLGDRTFDASTLEGQKTIAKRKLLGDLMALGIRPLKDADVEHYKESAVRPYDMLASIGAFLSPTDNVYKDDDLVGMRWRRYGAMAIVGAGVGYLLATGVTAMIAFALLGVCIGLAVMGILDVVGGVVHEAVRLSHWNTASLSTFTGRMKRKVPARVTELADRIGAVRPDVGFEVEYLQIDPFLTVTHPQYDDIKYRVAVWNEIGFRTTDR